MNVLRKLVCMAVMVMVSALAGCGKSVRTFPEKAPRPVTVLTLQRQLPSTAYVVSGAVKSWKTEQIGFEVEGRVQWVLEPGENVTRQIDGNGGTQLAQIDPVRYDVALESATAQKEVAKLSKDSIEIRFNDAIVAQLKSARAEAELAVKDATRIKQLFDQNAASQAELDQANNVVQVRQASIATLEAQQEQASADLKAAVAEVRAAEQAVRDARRNLENTKLYSSYSGQISELHVVPGSVVSPGSPVLTLQMMDPIKIEIEVSAEKSRQLKRLQQLQVAFTLPDGSLRRRNAFIYNIDTGADPSSRTFTLTLLLLNDKYVRPLPENTSELPIARAGDIWPLRVNRIVGAPEDIWIVDEKSVFEDQQGHYLLQVTNAQFGETFPELLKVKRQPVQLGDLQIPFLGLWTLQQIHFADPQSVDELSLVVGSVRVDSGTVADWRGDTVVMDRGPQWVLRPGDLVYVNLSQQAIEYGYYVPLNSIYEESGETFLFVVQGDTARKLPVQAVMPPSLDSGSLIEVRSPEIKDDMEIVVGGVHYLSDGDRVKVISQYDPAQEQS